MKNKYRDLILALFVALSLIVLIVIPVLAAYTATIYVNESAGTSYTRLPVIVAVNNTQLVSTGKISSTGLDTRITQGGSAIPHLLTDNKTLMVANLTASTNNTFGFSSNNSALASFPMIFGQGGYATTNDTAVLELGDSFQLVTSRYFATTNTVFEKQDAIKLAYNVTSQNLTLTVGNFTTPDMTLVATSVTPGEHVIRIKTGFVYSGGSSNVTLTVAANADDNGNENWSGTSTWSSGYNFLRMGNAGTYYPAVNFYSQLRFANATIPNAATISSAVLTYKLYNSDADPSQEIYCEDADNSTAASSMADLTGKSLTTGVASFIPGGWSAGSVYTFSSVGLTTAVQEVVDRAGWVSGNALSLLFRPTIYSHNAYTLYSKEGGYASQLYIEYGTTEITGLVVDLYVDDMVTPEDSDTMSTPIPDTANNWVWYPDPYINYIKLETSN